MDEPKDNPHVVRDLRRRAEAAENRADAAEESCRMMQDRLTRLVEAKSASHELGSPQNPLIGTYNPMSFKRWDSDLLVSLCERDDGYEINVIPIRSGPTRHYRIAPDGSWTDLAQPAPSAEKVLREALEKLARLGNEPDYGNSTAT